MTWLDIALFDKVKENDFVPERFQFAYCRSNDPEKAWSYNQNSHLNAWEVSSNFQWGFSHKHGNQMGYIVNNDVIFWSVAHVAT